MNWRKVVSLAVPLALLFFAVGLIVGLEVLRGPNWRLELDEYIAQHTTLSETIRIQAVTKARCPWNFDAAMGTAQPADWIIPSSPPEAMRCVLLVRSRPSGSGAQVESVARWCTWCIIVMPSIGWGGWLTRGQRSRLALLSGRIWR